MIVKLQPPSGDPGKMIFGLEPKPDQDWINRFNTRVNKSPSPIPLAINTKIEGNHLSLECATTADLQAVTDQVKKIVEEVNHEESDWDSRLKQVKV